MKKLSNILDKLSTSCIYIYLFCCYSIIYYHLGFSNKISIYLKEQEIGIGYLLLPMITLIIIVYMLITFFLYKYIKTKVILTVSFVVMTILILRTFANLEIIYQLGNLTIYKKGCLAEKLLWLDSFKPLFMNHLISLNDVVSHLDMSSITSKTMLYHQIVEQYIILENIIEPGPGFWANYKTVILYSLAILLTIGATVGIYCWFKDQIHHYIYRWVFGDYHDSLYEQYQDALSEQKIEYRQLIQQVTQWLQQHPNNIKQCKNMINDLVIETNVIRKYMWNFNQEAFNNHKLLKENLLRLVTKLYYMTEAMPNVNKDPVQKALLEELEEIIRSINGII